MISCGTLCVTLAVVGMFFPVLPTTPFLLLAAICYGRSSKRYYHWLTTNRWFGAYLRHYREGKGMTLQHKILTLLLLWLVIGYAAIFVVTVWWLRFILLAIAMGVTIHLIKIKTYKPDARNPDLSFRKYNSSEETV